MKHLLVNAVGYDLQKCFICDKAESGMTRMLARLTSGTPQHLESQQCAALDGFTDEHFRWFNGEPFMEALKLWKSNPLGLRFVDFCSRLGVFP